MSSSSASSILSSLATTVLICISLITIEIFPKDPLVSNFPFVNLAAHVIGTFFLTVLPWQVCEPVLYETTQLFATFVVGICWCFMCPWTLALMLHDTWRILRFYVARFSLAVFPAFNAVLSFLLQGFLWLHLCFLLGRLSLHFSLSGISVKEVWNIKSFSSCSQTLNYSFII